MPPAVPELGDSDRMGQPSVLPSSVLTLNPPVTMDNIGATIGVAANPLYSTPPVAPANPTPPPSLPAPVMQPVIQAPLVNPAPIVDNPILTPPVSSPQNSGLLFDPSIIGSSTIPNVISPVIQPVISPTSAASDPMVTQTLTRSDSLAAVIADLNKTLSKTTVGKETIGKFLNLQGQPRFHLAMERAC